MTQIIETVTITDEGDCTEVSVTDDDTIILHAEDADGVVDATYTLEQAKALRDALAHLIWSAEH
jgi:hypothetical protein